MSTSAELFQRASKVIPGGVHSPVRAFRGVGGSPAFFKRAEGSRIYDVDGRGYTDYCMAFGPLILGHLHPAVQAAATAAISDGWSYGTAEPYSLALAELLASRIPWVDSLRLVNSGTEAVMSAIRLARGATGRAKILKFEGCYHGHSDAVLIGAGSGLAYQSKADSAGVPAGVAADTLVLPLDDEQALNTAFTGFGNEIAAVLIEPLPANYGLLPQRRDFLVLLRKLCSRHGSVLIFDEVISGFRLAFGGMAEVTGIHPDLVTYGKILGGGFPIGAFAGSRALMEQVAPLGDVYQAGTLSANPVGVRAGLATLEQLLDGAVYTRLSELGGRLARAFASHEMLQIRQIGSLFWIASGLSPGATVRSKTDVPQSLGDDYAALFHALLLRGIYLSPSAYEVGFLSTAHTDRDIDDLIEALTGWGDEAGSDKTGVRRAT